MTEAEWRDCTDPQTMLEFLRDSGKGSERSIRLFTAACCRRVWHQLTDERSRQAVETLEGYAEGLARVDELAAAALAAEDAVIEEPAGGVAVADVALNAVFADLPDADSRREEEEKHLPLDYITNAQDATYAAGCVVGRSPHRGGRGDADAVVRKAEDAVQCHLLRCVLGNPFRPLSLDPAWLTADVLSLAQATYDNRALPAGTLDPARLGLLADALEDAGCADGEVLGHLRGEGPHVRGCWALDLLLSKE